MNGNPDRFWFGHRGSFYLGNPQREALDDSFRPSELNLLPWERLYQTL